MPSLHRLSVTETGGPDPSTAPTVHQVDLLRDGVACDSTIKNIVQYILNKYGSWKWVLASAGKRKKETLRELESTWKLKTVSNNSRFLYVAFQIWSPKSDEGGKVFDDQKSRGVKLLQQLDAAQITYGVISEPSAHSAAKPYVNCIAWHDVMSE